ncbi:hypothetical protein RHMOL_Rhmol02G0020000 [Rhododendron molle]|uniref:Uncharacterized protein n=1 Tax=Rhododendron molle TaxID=49168 RepID=A0ACC0PKJ4_RHOML|nr:hypothetical protein RHMOL_Rhmol02G0020000 [Rhododendron molle]
MNPDDETVSDYLMNLKSKDWRMVGFPYAVGSVESGVVLNGNLDKYQKRGTGSWECFYMGEKDFVPQHSEEDDQSETDEE